MKQIILFFALFCFSLSSCTNVMMLVMGMEQPEYKSDIEVKEYAQKTFEYEGDIFRMKSYSENAKVPPISNTLPALMYSDNGKLHRFTTSCLRNYPKIIEEVNLDKYTSQIDTSYLLEDLSDRFYSLQGNDFTIEDETFVVFYSRFVGRLNKSDVLPWMAEIESKTDSPIVFVNCDYSEEVK